MPHLSPDETSGIAADESTETRLRDLLATLSLEEKVQLLTGRDFWNTWPIPKIGLRRILVSDGPSGVRGESWDERDPSLNFPSATALASAWDRELAYRYGAAAAVEARRKGVDVILGPTINLHRSPLGGRHFEAFSEDPLLTAELAAAYVEGVQINGVGATPKHYIANDSETDRFTVDAVLDERTLRELYLLAFEKAVVDSHAWLVMSSYNSINGVTATENSLLETPLNSEWGFDGVVISDWTAVRSIASARASQDLVMPGPHGPWGNALVSAVRTGAVNEEAIDRKVLRILRLASRVGALEGFEPVAAAPLIVEDGIALVREAAAAGSVLLTNSSELPWSATDLRSVAVIGQNAAFVRTQGGGSATVLPEKVVSPLDGIRAALPSSSVTYSLGAVVREGITPLSLSQLTNPATSAPGIRVTFRDADNNTLLAQDRLSTSLVWFGGDAPIAQTTQITLETIFIPDSTGSVRLGFATVGTARLFVDGVVVIDEALEWEGTDLAGALLTPPSTSAPVPLSAGDPIAIRLEYDVPGGSGPLRDALAFTFGLDTPDEDAAALIAEAVEAARDAEVVVVVVGTSAAVESEGFDRQSLALPGSQDDLVRAVAAVNSHTVVVVNAGSPVLMPWRDDVAAVLVGYFGGQEFGNAVADMLLGRSEPGGRLPTTWPALEADVPVLSTTPIDGELEYSEGIHLGYRAWLRAGRTPAYPFGHGLGYTQFTMTNPTVSATVRPGADALVTVDVANIGRRAGKHVIQVYAERAHSAVDRPVRWLVGFQPVWMEPHARDTVALRIPARTLAYWDSGWAYEAGEFILRLGSSVDDLPLRVTIALDADGDR